nr:reverse transcriptase domain-containing protein [Tanacetum cinerariifolium]
TVFKRLEKGVFHRLGDKEKNVFAHSRGSERKSYYSSHRDTESCYQSSRSKETETASEKHRHKREYLRRTKAVSEREGSAGGHWKSKPKKQKSSMDDDLSQPWGAPECMKIFGFMHGIINPELIKLLHDKIPKSMDEMMSVTTAFLRGDITASNRERKKSFPYWKQETGQKKNFKRGNFQNEQRMERKQDIFTLLTKTPREILALDKGNFKPSSPMTTPIEKRNASKFCEFHGEVGHTTDECMHLKRQIEEMLKAGKLSHLIKELKQNHEKDQAKIAKKGETSGKDKSLAILIVQPWQRIVRQRITQTFSPESVISFATLGEEDGTEGPMIIVAEMGGHCVHPIYVDGGSSSEILYKHCFRQISLLVRIGDEEHSTSAWMNFMVVRSPSPYNRIIGRPGVRKIRAIPSMAHGMIKFPVAGGIVTLQSSRIIPLECSMVSEPGVPRSAINQEGRKELCGLLRRHLDVFAWKPADMTGVPRHIAEHRLNVREGCLPIRQKKRGQASERNKAINEEVKKLVESDIMKEVHYHSWLLNPVMVKKHDDSWRIATYQRLVDKAFQKQIGRNLKVYVDDLVIKSRTEKEVIRDIEETFKTLRKINMKLNPKKCAFGMREGTFLGYKVDADGLRVSADKVKAVLDLPSPKCLKDVQKLNENWIEKEELIMYLAAAKEAISAVLMTERDGKQVPVYFVSRELQGPEINHTPMEKLILALVSASTRSKRYFHAHTIIVITDQPKKQLLSNPEVTRRLLKWRFELGEHDIQYQPRTSVKGQILADFIVERPEDDAPDTPMEDREELPDPWIFFTDGSSCIDGSGAGLIITNPEGMEFTYALREKTIDEKEILAVVEEEGHTWMTPVYEYLTEGILPEEKKKARTVHRKAGRYVVINEVLYKKSFLGPWLRCVGPLQAKYVLREIHEGSCSMHVGPRSVVAKALRSGEIVFDNGKQFRDNPFKDSCEKLSIRQCFASVKHHQANSLVERANRSLGEGIKARLGLDLLEEKSEQAAIQEAMNKAKMEGYYNARVRSTSFRPGDFVYRSNEASHAKDGGKLGPKWEGLYEVTEALGK